MHIAVDGNEANVAEQVGVSVYAYNLLRYFQKQATAEIQFTVFLRKPPLDFLPAPIRYFQYRVVSGPFLWSAVFLPLELYRLRRFDCFFSPAHYSPKFCPAPLIVTIHDLSYFYFPDEFLKKDLYKLKNWTAASVKKAAKIIAVSKNTKKDIVKFYAVPDETIEVVYNGYEKTAVTTAAVKIQTTLLPSRKYILYVGTLQPRKNLAILLTTFAKFQRLHSDYQLVIAGKKGWLYDQIFQKVNDLGIANSVVFPGYVSDEELIYLYRRAFCSVMPSLYEGFGIPILEAMSYGCPVISSFSSSLSEIGGEASLYFDPQDEEDLLEKLAELKSNPALAKDLVTKGKARVKLFSWEKCARETLEIIKSIGK
ncbi:glycosyltransferase family 4 protein [Candidatus Roizmanbacteria bacterium]|nr:glycosyltransferase family 4 protein [Candidatus Roizmanbacteria bacterium]